jgi:hypothetical protein
LRHPDCHGRHRAGGADVSILAKGCDNVWHALAFAEGDPVNLQVTPQGAVLTE